MARRGNGSGGKKAIMYRCGTCGRGILADSEGKDPVHILSRGGVRCTECLRKPDPAAAEERSRAGLGSEARKAAAKARWDAKTPEEQAAQMAKMRAARVATSDVA